MLTKCRFHRLGIGKCVGANHGLRIHLSHWRLILRLFLLSLRNLICLVTLARLAWCILNLRVLEFSSYFSFNLLSALCLLLRLLRYFYRNWLFLWSSPVLGVCLESLRILRHLLLRSNLVRWSRIGWLLRKLRSSTCLRCCCIFCLWSMISIKACLNLPLDILNLLFR